MVRTNAALLVVDVQNDFCPGGALAVAHGDRVVPVLNRCIAEGMRHGVHVYASRDWHPPVSDHFAAYGGPWPPHCVQHTSGAEFHPDLELPRSTILITKGDDPHAHGYSAFDGHTADGRSLIQDLRARQIDQVYIGGLATDYCVRTSVLDARRAGLWVAVLADAITGIDVQPGDCDRALEEMRAAGAHITSSSGWLETVTRNFQPRETRP